MYSQKILLPYNFTKYDQKALDFVIRNFAHLKDIEITLFNVYIPVPEIETRESPIMEKMKSNLIYLSQKIKEQEAGLKTAKENLLQNDFTEDRIRSIFKPRKKDVAGEIIDLASKEHFDLIVLNHEPGKKVTRFFTESVFSKVVAALKDAAVCIVT